MEATNSPTIAIHDTGSREIARSILSGLPEWFGIPASLEMYVDAAARMPMATARNGAGEPLGFLSLRRHSPRVAEAFVLGVRRDLHRQGVGRALFTAAQCALSAEGVRYLTVKTPASGHPDPHYAITRRFYETIGFEPLETLPTLWGEGMPCLFMIKAIGLPA